MQFTPVPNIVFSSLLPEIKDINELKTLLYIFQLIYPKKGSVRYVSLNELASQSGLMNGFVETEPLDALSKTLAQLVAKNIILSLRVDRERKSQDLYFINNEAGKNAVAGIRSGQIEIPGFEPVAPVNVASGPLPDIFTLYEQNIGMLTPIIADELREAGKQYPENWIREAFKEAVALNKRNWRYIARILEHWSVEGKDDGTHRRNITQNTDPDKYIKGRYGHMVQR